jgi:hypothetical protein
MIGFGDESHYSWGSMLESSLVSGLGAGIMPLPNFASSAALGGMVQSTMKSLVEQAGVAVFEELLAVKLDLTQALCLLEEEQGHYVITDKGYASQEIVEYIEKKVSAKVVIPNKAN